MKNAWWLTLNILKVSFRKRSTLITFFILPLIGILLSVGIYSNAGRGSVNIGLIDQDGSVISRDMVQSLKNEGKFKIIPVGEVVAGKDIVAGKVDCVLTIPHGFGENVYAGRSLEIKLVSLKGEAVTAWIKNYLNTYIQNLRDLGEASGGSSVFMQVYQHYRQKRLPLKVIAVRDDTRNKQMSTQSFGFLIMFMLVGVGNSVEMILREKRSRTYYRICASPVSARVYIIGNVLANLMIIIIQVLLVLWVMTKVVGMETYIPLPQLFAILTLYGLAAIGLGLLIVAFSNDTSQAGIMQNLIITPSCFLAGCFWPVDIMPKALQRIADFMPQRWAIAAIQKLQEGVGFDKVFIHIGIILAFAMAFFMIAAYRFARSGDVKTFV